MITFKPFSETDASIWNDIISHSNQTCFFTDLDWVDFQKTNRKKSTDQFLIYNEDQSVGVLYLEISRRRIAKYAYAPYNPIVLWDKVDEQAFWKALAEFAKQYIAQEKLNYFKIDPYLQKSKLSNHFHTHWKKSFSPGQSKDMWEITLENDAEAQLKAFKKDTRYYVRRAAKQGVTVRESKTEEDVRTFVSILNETKSRQGFDNFEDDYYVEQWRKLHKDGADNKCSVFLAYKDKTPIAGALINYHKDWLYYSHAGSTSDPELAKLAAPYVLQYEIVKDGIEKGKKYYSMWGVLPTNMQHPWKGMSDFKKKFPGELITYAGTFETHNLTFGYLLNTLYDWWVYRNDRY